jgi:hypothetical protein
MHWTRRWAREGVTRSYEMMTGPTCDYPVGGIPHLVQAKELEKLQKLAALCNCVSVIDAAVFVYRPRSCRSCAVQM